jgi:hypothetical protein
VKKKVFRRLEIEIKGYNRKLNETTMYRRFNETKISKKPSLKLIKYSIQIFFNGNWQSFIIFEIRRDFKKIRKHERLKEITKNATKKD